MTSPADLLTAAEVAALKGCDESTVTRAARAEEIPARRLGRAWVIRRADAERWQPRTVGRPKIYAPSRKAE